MINKIENFVFAKENISQKSEKEMIFRNSEAAKNIWSDIERIVGTNFDLYTKENPYEATVMRTRGLENMNDSKNNPLNLGVKISVYWENTENVQLMYLHITYLTAAHKIAVPVEAVLKKEDNVQNRISVRSEMLSEDLLEKIHVNLLGGLSMTKELE